MTKIYQGWVKKLVSKAQWGSWYSRNSSYCKLREDASGVWVGFLVADDCPNTCEPMGYEELRQVDDYRRANRIAPFPLKEIKVEKKEASSETLKVIDEIRAKLSGKMNVEKPEVNPIQTKTEKPADKPNPEPEPYHLTEEEKETLRQVPF